MKHQRLHLAVYLLISSITPAAFGAGPAAPPAGGGGKNAGPAGSHGSRGNGSGHHSPPIHHSHHAHAMPQQIQNFNATSAFAAQNPMDLGARAALQASANALATQYRGLQQDAKGGSFDTSGMGDMMKNFAGNVTEAKLQPVREVTPSPELASSSASNSNQQAQQAAQNISITVQAPEPHLQAEPTPAADPAVAQADEQIIPDLQNALNTAEKTAPLAAASGDFARAGGESLALLPIAASGSLEKKDAFVYDMPAAAGEETAHSTRSLASSGDADSGSASSASSDSSVASSGSSDVSNDGPHAPGEIVVGEGAREANNAGLPDMAKRLLPKNLRTSRRVQGGPGEAGESSGFFANLKRAVFGVVARTTPKSSFYQPLDFKGQPVEASLGDEEENWWQPMALPLGFTSLFCGIVWMGSRQRRAKRATIAKPIA